jgi:DNA replication protein DnaC
MKNIRNFIDKLDLADKSPAEIFNTIALSLAPKFEINLYNEETYNQLKYYFSNDKRFKGDLSKSLLLLGSYGTGKTFAMKLFMIFNFVMKTSKYFSIYNSDEIIDTFCSKGRSSIEFYNPERSNICIDELGQDSGKHYYFGSVDDPIGVLMRRRYDLFIETGIKTHAISNLDLDGFRQRFGSAIYDRMFEMFNIVVFESESWRRKNL